MDFSYRTSGSCAQLIEGRIEDGTIQNISFVGGCRGNLQGIARLVVGRTCHDVAELLLGIQCRNGTSCPDQLAKALQQHALAKAS